MTGSVLPLITVVVGEGTGVVTGVIESLGNVVKYTNGGTIVTKETD